jgi:DNA replication protein DnaC
MDRPMQDGETQPFRRELTQDDLVRARVPMRYWTVNLAGVQEQVRGIADKYLKEIAQMHERGVGLLLWGANGIGKTSLAVVLGKEYRRRGHSLMFLESAELKGAIIHNEAFDEEHTLWDRAKSVDVLLIDDLGKGVQDSTGFGARVLDELIRHRNANKRVTFITTNMTLKALEDELKASTMHSLKECIYPVRLLGEDLREKAKQEIGSLLS